MNKIIFRCKFGAHLYGTNTENSDEDYKSIFIPDAKELVLQRAAKHIQQNTKKNSVTKNSNEDIDDESFSVQSFLKLLCEGQTVALDMLFCPKELTLITSPEWELIKSHKDSFIHKGTSAFVGYTKQQAAKYGVKGFRVSALREILEWLNNMHDHVRLGVCITEKTLPTNENIKIVQILGKGGLEPHLEVCNRKVPFHATVKYATEVFQRIFDMYGERALKAEKNEGIDWKALSHAVRVANESIELLQTGKITFPRPDRTLLLSIKKGELPYKEVESIIEQGLIKVEDAQMLSALPKEPDYKLADQLVYTIYRDVLEESFKSEL